MEDRSRLGISGFSAWQIAYQLYHVMSTPFIGEYQDRSQLRNPEDRPVRKLREQYPLWIDTAYQKTYAHVSKTMENVVFCDVIHDHGTSPDSFACPWASSGNLGDGMGYNRRVGTE
jgi:hypothetical protein